ncbi:MAG: hypothetical protein JXR34_10585, partial [Bacteroidales bacterium]|nr:hypothetical protein [Bacteroidales bacterium]
MNREAIIESLVHLGVQIRSVLDGDTNQKYYQQLTEAMDRAGQVNPWFERRFVILSLSNISRWLQKENLVNWVEGYSFDYSNPKKIALVMAGNIPLVGFHDFLSVFISGNIAVIKMSSKDVILFPALMQILFDFKKEFKERINISNDFLKDFDAVIATGSDNSGKYFDFYFGKFPSIIRRNRNSVAVLHSDDSVEVFKLLSNDIMDYFGLGCRSVSKIYVPYSFDKELFLSSFEHHQNSVHNYKYFNNYEY